MWVGQEERGENVYLRREGKGRSGCDGEPRCCVDLKD